MASTSTHLDYDAWLINIGAYFHMDPRKGWFCEYEKYNERDVFLEYDSTTNITTWKGLVVALKWIGYNPS